MPGTLKGSCVGCGYCCEWMHFCIPNTYRSREYFEARGGILVQDDTAFGGTAEYRFPIPCPHHVNSACDLHNEKNSAKQQKPQVCIDYPSMVLGVCEENGLDPQKGLGPDCGYCWEMEEAPGSKPPPSATAKTKCCGSFGVKDMSGKWLCFKCKKPCEWAEDNKSTTAS